MTDTHRDGEDHGRAGLPLEGALRRARWTIFWERLWPALATLATAVGLFLTLSWLGLWLWLPPIGRAAGVIAFAVLALAAAVPFALLRLPAAAEALRRLDRGSGLAHRPATTIADVLAVSSADPYSLALWNAHIARTRAAARRFAAGWPSPRIAARDPYALRGLVLIACIATFVAAGGERWKRVAAAFEWQGVMLPANFRVDAWVTPPAYTGKPPVILAGIHPGETARVGVETGEASGDGAVAVPVGSTLVVRATGNLTLDLAGHGGVAPAKDEGHAPAGTQEHRFTIAADGSVTLRGAGDDLTWSFDAIPDRAPTIALTKDPEQQNRGSMLLSYRLEDDYGVTHAQATFARKAPATNEAETKQAGTNDQDQGPHPLFGPPDFVLTLPQARTKNGVGQTIKDLTDHPWAGAEVVMTLVARDEGGNEGKSEPFTLRLPERVFTKPLARALIEQRRNLALDAHARPMVITALDALALAPERFTPDAGVYLGLRAIFWSLVRAKSDDDLREVVTQLWSMAVGIEDGNMSDAQAALRNAEEALRQALDRGASDQEIKQLMDQLRAAMDRFMQAMQEQLKNNQQLARPLGRNSKVLRSQDLKSMLDRLENMARNGSKDAARQMLQQLEQMMENLQMASPDQNGDDSDDMMSALDDLGDMIREQQELRDHTFRQGQERRRQNAQRQQGQESQPGDQGDQNELLDQLRQRQQALRDRLDKLLEDLKNRGFGQGQKGQQGRGQSDSDQLGRAGDAMGEAEGRLGDGNAESAVDFARPRARRAAQGRAGPGAIDAAADGPGSGSGAERPHGLAARAAGHRPARPSAARPRLWRRLHRQSAGRDRRAARPPHHRGAAPPLRRRRPPAGGARLHRAAVEGLLSCARRRSGLG